MGIYMYILELSIKRVINGVNANQFWRRYISYRAINAIIFKKKRFFFFSLAQNKEAVAWMQMTFVQSSRLIAL
jgi:hypothetical protein